MTQYWGHLFEINWVVLKVYSNSLSKVIVSPLIHHSSIHSLFHLPIHSVVYPFILHSINHSFIYPFIPHSLIHPVIHSFVHLPRSILLLTWHDQPIVIMVESGSDVTRNMTVGYVGLEGGKYGRIGRGEGGELFAHSINCWSREVEIIERRKFDSKVFAT